MYDAAWLERYLDWPDAGDFVAFKRFHKLYFVRRYAAKLLYELELHRSDNPRSKSKRYADLLTTHLGVRYNPADYLFDVDDGFYCARYLRAWAFEAQLRRHLESDFGGQWFLSAKAGQAPHAALVDGPATAPSRSWRRDRLRAVWTSRRCSTSWKRETAHNMLTNNAFVPMLSVAGTINATFSKGREFLQ